MIDIGEIKRRLKKTGFYHVSFESATGYIKVMEPYLMKVDPDEVKSMITRVRDEFPQAKVVKEGTGNKKKHGTGIGRLNHFYVTFDLT